MNSIGIQVAKVNRFCFKSANKISNNNIYSRYLFLRAMFGCEKCRKYHIEFVNRINVIQAF